MPKPPAPRDPDEWYPVMLCVKCKHPGGQHILDGGCRLCAGCPGWGEQQGVRGYWNDRMTDAAGTIPPGTQPCAATDTRGNRR